MKVQLDFPIIKEGMSEYFEEFPEFAENYQPDFDPDSYREDHLLNEIKEAYKLELMQDIEDDIDWHLKRIFEVAE